MKILGHARIKPRTEVVNVGELDNGEALTIELKAPRLNDITELDAKLDPPAAPLAPAGEVMRDSRKRVLKDADGKPMTTRNEKDPAHIKALAEWQELADRCNRAKTIGLLLICMGEQVVPEAKLEDYTDGNGGPGKAGVLVDYYDAVWTELEDFGIDLVGMGALTDAAMRLAGIGDDELDAAREKLGASSGN